MQALVGFGEQATRPHACTGGLHDGNLVYWANSLRDHPLTTSRTGILLRRQRGRGKLAHCRLLFTDADTITVKQFTPPNGTG